MCRQYLLDEHEQGLTGNPVGMPRILHTIASIRSSHGGTSRSVPDLCNTLIGRGLDVHLLAGAPADRSAECGGLADDARTHLVRECRWNRQWGVVSGFRRELSALVTSAANGILIHDHGVWLPTNHGVAVFSRKANLKRIVSPRGMLSDWALRHGWLKKRLAWTAYQHSDLAAATAFHATSAEEAHEIHNLGLRQPIAVIPNGIDFPENVPRKTADCRQRTMLFLSRIHPKKGLLNLVQAWKDANIEPNWRLVIAGPSEGGHRGEVERLAAALGVGAQISFPGELNDREKWGWYSNADIFVLPTFSENFGIVVAEALAVGTPVLTTTGTPWKELAERQAGWCVEPSRDSIATALRAATRLSPEELATMGCRGAEWVRKRFSWRDVGGQMCDFYSWLSQGGAAPACVQQRNDREGFR